MVNEFQKRGYKKLLIKQKIDKANSQEREQLLKEKQKTLLQLSLYRSNITEHSLTLSLGVNFLKILILVSLPLHWPKSHEKTIIDHTKYIFSQSTISKDSKT